MHFYSYGKQKETLNISKGSDKWVKKRKREGKEEIEGEEERRRRG